MLENKKIRNTQKIVYDGIKFKSKLESSCYKKLLEAGLPAIYEKTKFVLLPSAKLSFVKLYAPNQKKSLCLKPSYREMSYTPDFEFEFRGHMIFYDTKGMPNETYPLKKKLFLHYLETIGSSFIFFEPHNMKQIEESITILYELPTEY